MVMTTAQIVENDRANTDTVHLYREGIFLKAYNRSAFLFQKHFRNFRAVKKYFKSVGEDVVMLGFPSSNLPSVFPDGNYQSGDGSHISVESLGGFDLREYSLWFDAIQLLPEKPKKPVHKKEMDYDIPFSQVSLFDPLGSHATSNHKSIFEKITEELEAFSIENSTPMECMMFLSKLKTELKKGKSGNI